MEEEIPEPIHIIVGKFGDVFQEPKGLPPLHGHEYSIVLKEGVGPKSSFGLQRLEYLKHVVSKEGVSADKLKIQTMLEWPKPKTLKELRGFLGLTGYYRKFVKNYSKIAAPLTQQLKKDAFDWGEEACKAFVELKTAMMRVTVLALPNFKDTTRPLQSGTPKGGLREGAHGYCSSHQQVETLSSRRHFIIRTDQKSLKYLLEQRLVAEEHQHWLTKLIGYDFEIHYMVDKENQAADVLSHKIESIHSNLEDKVAPKGAGNDGNMEMTLAEPTSARAQGLEVPAGRWGPGVFSASTREELSKNNEAPTDILLEAQTHETKAHLNDDQEEVQRVRDPAIKVPAVTKSGLGRYSLTPKE
ncbi:hypothetical protein QQ045_007419 [Rhodiola kirilowii]